MSLNLLCRRRAVSLITTVGNNFHNDIEILHGRHSAHRCIQRCYILRIAGISLTFKNCMGVTYTDL